MLKKQDEPFLEQMGDDILIYGYARCSTDENRQDIDRQKRELLKLGVAGEKTSIGSMNPGQEQTDQNS